jgi:aldehyde dehydrogenase (NAD+)
MATIKNNIDTDSICRPVFTKQIEYFNNGKTRNIDYRIKTLKKLRRTILDNENEIFTALHADLNKSGFESYATETGFVLEEIRYHIKHLKRWAKPIKSSTPITNFPASSYITHEPLGTVLIIAPWNYPFQLLIAPLIGAISAGNTAILKPSELSKATSEILERIINNNFDTGNIHVIPGDAQVTQSLLKLEFNHIFFTGSTKVGKIVMERAAKNLVPVTLELGGKSPCIVHNDINLKLAAKRIVWGKLLNAGQTCIAPDYILVQQDVKDELIKNIIQVIQDFFGPDASTSNDYPRIINKSNITRLAALLNNTNIIYGGNYSVNSKYFEPTIIDNVNIEMPVMKQEIFGPIIPVLSYKSLEDVIKIVNSLPKPLALYFFSKSKANHKLILNNITAGGVTINDTIMHIANNQLPFGGVGSSGIGSYHGEFSFEVFSNKKPVVHKKTWLDIPIRYAPYKNKLKLLKLLMR